MNNFAKEREKLLRLWLCFFAWYKLFRKVKMLAFQMRFQLLAHYYYLPEIILTKGAMITNLCSDK
jgi:hypothetical protein